MTSLNIQAMARRDKGLMSSLIPEDGEVFASLDLMAGEPTITSWLTKDTNYMYASFSGVGKAPYYNGSVLMIDDIYLMGMSVSPIGSKVIRDLYTSTHDGLTFSELWLKDNEVIKNKIKKERQLHKMAILGFGYGLGPNKLYNNLKEQGYNITLEQCRNFHKAYWTLFSGVKAFADKCSRLVEEKGHICNPFGFRGTPEPHKAYNWVIQSSINTVINLMLFYLMKRAPYAKFVTCVHDELIVSLKETDKERFDTDRLLAEQDLNNHLKLSVPIRTGCVFGNNLYEAK